MSWLCPKCRWPRRSPAGACSRCGFSSPPDEGATLPESDERAEAECVHGLGPGCQRCAEADDDEGMERTPVKMPPMLVQSMGKTGERAAPAPDPADGSSPPSSLPVFVDQRTQDDCYTACIASLTGLQLEDFPAAPEVRNRQTEVGYVNAIVEHLARHRWMLLSSGTRVPAGWSIVTGQSPRREGIAHCVLARDGVLMHDPHPDRTFIDSEPWEFELVVRLA